jgi:Mg2+/citrate symporter
MRPRIILGILLITLTFFLILMISPGFWHRKAIGRVVVTRFENPTPQNVQALRLEQDRARRSQYIICSLLVVNVVAVIVYGALQQHKGTLSHQAAVAARRS